MKRKVREPIDSQFGGNVAQRDRGCGLHHEYNDAIVEGCPQGGQGGTSSSQPQCWLPAATRGL